MQFDGNEIAQASRGECVRSGARGKICTDTRTLQAGEWFLAIVGERFDGHNFCEKAREIGVAGIIGQHVPQDWDLGFVRVSDSLVALQNIARYIRKQYTGLVVAITGSAGKTTSRALISSVLSQKGSVLATAGNFNNHIGLPLTLLRSDLTEDFWVLEMGMNHFGEIQLLQEIAQPHIRLITNVGAAHLEGVGSLDGVAKAKGELFDGANVGDLCVRNADDEKIMQHPLPSGIRTVEFGENSSSAIRIVHTHIDVESLSTIIQLETPLGVLDVSISSPGIHLASNVASAVAIGLDQHCSLEELQKGIASYTPVGARLLVENGAQNTKWINDAYNANPLSVRASLHTLSLLEGHTRVALLGDMLELGEQAYNAHKEVLNYALSLPIEKVGVCGTIFAKVAQEYSHHTKLFATQDSTELGNILKEKLYEGDLILLKGSRGIRMETARSIWEKA